MGLDARVVFFAFVCPFVLCCCFRFRKNQVISFLRSEESRGEETRRPIDLQTDSTKSMTGGQASSCPSTP